MKYQQKLVFSVIFLSLLPVLSLLFCFDYNLFTTDFEFASRKFARLLGSVSGIIGALLIVWQYILGNRFTSRFFGKDIIWNNTIHKNIGKYGMLLVFIHPYLIAYSYFEDLLWIYTPELATEFGKHVALGRIGLILIGLIWLTSAILKSRISYRPWKFIHLASYPTFFFVFLHATEIGTVLGTNNIIQLIWFTALSLAIVPLGMKLLSAFGLTAEKVYVISKDIQSGVTILTVQFEQNFPEIVPGQYMYIMIRKFGEAHPFSIMEYSLRARTITFGIRNIGKLSDQISKLELGEGIYLDGPYGEFTIEGHNEDPKIFIAGGVGITPFVEPIKQFRNDQTYLFYSNFKLEYAIKRDELKDVLKSNYCNFITDEKIDGANIYCEKINVERIKKIIAKDTNKYKFFVCGSPGFVDAMNTMLKNSGISKEQIFTEGFGL